MIKFHDSTSINRPMPEVFAFVSDLEKIPLWQSDVVRSTVVTPGPVRAGTQFTEVVKIGPWKVTARCQVTDYDGKQHMSFSAASKPIHYQGRIDLEEVLNQTTVALSGTARLRGFWRLMQPVLAGEIRKGLAHELEQMKQHLDRGR